MTKSIHEVFRFLFGTKFKEVEITRLDDETGEVEYTPMGVGGALGVDIIHDEKNKRFLAVTYYYDQGVWRYADGSGQPPSWEPVEHEWRKNLLDVARDIMLFNMNEELVGLSEALSFIDMEEWNEPHHK